MPLYVKILFRSSEYAGISLESGLRISVNDLGIIQSSQAYLTYQKIGVDG